jgi:ABC-type transport system substrate-binding protein
MVRYARSDVSHTYFNMESPVVGGYAPEKVALRRAISLGLDVDREIRLVRQGQAIPAQSLVGPGVWGYDRGFKSESSEFDRGKAKALLDLYGYVDRDGDGWRDMPDGSPLLLEYATSPGQDSRQLTELWQKDMAALGLRIRFVTAQWPEQLKAARAGKLMMWGLGWAASVPDAEDFLSLAYGPNKGQSNLPRFDLPAYNRLFERLKTLPDGPERSAGIA